MVDFFPPRPYHSLADLEAMKHLLSQGILAQGAGFYVHPGDLQWWLFYPPIGTDLVAHTWLWDDPAQHGEILAWMLVDPTWYSFELFVQPALYASEVHRQMYLWAEAQAWIICPPDAVSLKRLWIGAEDAFQRTHLENRGFHEKASDTFFLCSLAEPVAGVAIPGWTARLCRGATELTERASAQYGAFQSQTPFDLYLARWNQFIRSAAYAGALDVVAANLDGQIGAFCIAWLDEATRRGHLEPVGTHPDFQRQGLGRLVLSEALRRLKACGMREVSVCTSAGNEPAQAFYASLGFKPTETLSLYEKSLVEIPLAAREAQPGEGDQNLAVGSGGGSS